VDIQRPRLIACLAHHPQTRLPIDTNRRRFLSVAASGAVAAALPVAAFANSSDPIFAAIERHRELSADYTAAVDISSKLEDGPEFEAADAIAGDRCDDLLNHADALIRLKPTTTAGVIALMRYVASLEEWQTPREPDEFDGQAPDWGKTFCTTVASALDQIGGAVA
jgi:hypothetical protein